MRERDCEPSHGLHNFLGLPQEHLQHPHQMQQLEQHGMGMASEAAAPSTDPSASRLSTGAGRRKGSRFLNFDSVSEDVNEHGMQRAQPLLQLELLQPMPAGLSTLLHKTASSQQGPAGPAGTPYGGLGASAGQRVRKPGGPLPPPVSASFKAGAARNNVSKGVKPGQHGSQHAGTLPVKQEPSMISMHQQQVQQLTAGMQAHSTAGEAHDDARMPDQVSYLHGAVQQQPVLGVPANPDISMHSALESMSARSHSARSGSGAYAALGAARTRSGLTHASSGLTTTLSNAADREGATGAEGEEVGGMAGAGQMSPWTQARPARDQSDSQLSNPLSAGLHGTGCGVDLPMVAPGAAPQMHPASTHSGMSSGDGVVEDARAQAEAVAAAVLLMSGGGGGGIIAATPQAAQGPRTWGRSGSSRRESIRETRECCVKAGLCVCAYIPTC